MQLTVYNNEVFNFIQKDFEIETLAEDCIFTEGPVWNTDGYYLFSDIPSNCIYRIEGGEGSEGKSCIWKTVAHRIYTILISSRIKQVLTRLPICLMAIS